MVMSIQASEVSKQPSNKKEKKEKKKKLNQKVNLIFKVRIRTLHK